MKEQDKAAFNAWVVERGVWPRLTHEEIWQAACDYKEKQAAQAEPVASVDVDYKSWYDEAMIASNEAGYVGLDPAQTIRELNKLVQSGSVQGESVAVMASAGQIVKGVMLTPDGSACFCCFAEEEVKKRLANGYKHVYTEAPAVAVNLESIEQYRLQMAAIGTAAFGYWKEGDSIHSDYDTVPLRDVAKLHAKYESAVAVNEQLLEALKAVTTAVDLTAYGMALHNARAAIAAAEAAKGGV